MTYPFGIDISAYQYSQDGSRKPDFDLINEKCDFVAVRAGISWGYTDKWFEYSWSHVLRPRLAYHVVYPGESATAQMKHFLNIVHPTQNDRLVLDMELDHGYSKARITKTLVDCMNIIQTETGRYPVIYSRAYWVNDHLDVNALPEKTDWWLANYLRSNPDPYFTPEMTPPPMLPNGVKNWLIHQTSKEQDGSKVGVVSHYVDTNRWNGTHDELLAYFGLGEETPEPEPPVEVEDKLFDAKVTTTPPNRLKTRYTPNGAERPKADWLQSQAVVPVYETHSTGWWRVAPEAWSSATWMERVEDKLPEPQEPLFQARVYSWATPYVNVRAEPSLSSNKVGFKYPLAVTDVMSTVSDWYEVPEGWMMSSFLERLDDEPPVISTGKYYGALYWQRDPRWKDKPLGTSGTIGSYGCVMTAETNALNQLGIKTNPVANNAWRTENNGYHNGNLIVWEKVTEQHPDIIWEGKTWNPTDAQIKQKIADGCPLVMLVDHNEGTPALDEHWVNSIPSPIDDGAIWIHDPWDNSTIRLRDRYKKPIQQFSSYRRI